MWITNSGFADVFFVFCKIENDDNILFNCSQRMGSKLGEENKLEFMGHPQDKFSLKM